MLVLGVLVRIVLTTDVVVDEVTDGVLIEYLELVIEWKDTKGNGRS